MYIVNSGDDPVVQLMNALGNTIDPTIRMQIQSAVLTQKYLKDKEHETLVKEITDEVLSRISFSVDITEVINEINQIKEAINSLGK